ncbi:hypothetical protein B0H12DRAFT_1044377 [Mycena haematopus]|nr:hypothetical protein B0H12DRAFT_1044377 [Mycena haematopus]
MDSPAANRVPDEIVSEILTPLLKHSDEVFCDQSQKPLLDPDHSASRYLLVSKSWLRVSTPLLYNVIILRTTAQAEALQAVLKNNQEFGLFIKKLRVEGGFGDAMHTIFKCAPNITDLYLTLYIAGTDNVKGLCSGLPLINPRRVIVVDACYDSEVRPKKNKKITELFEALVSLIPKWDEMQTFQFPYLDHGRDSIIDPRAAALISALTKSRSLKTLVVGMGPNFPEYLHQMVDAPSLKSINFILFRHLKWNPVSWGLEAIREAIDEDARLKALVSYHELEEAEQTQRDNAQLPVWRYLEGDGETTDTDEEDDEGDFKSGRTQVIFVREQPIRLGVDKHGNSFCPKQSAAYAEGLPALIKLGQTIGGTVNTLSIFLHAQSADIDLTPFTSVTYLKWAGTADEYSFSAPGPAVSVLPLLEELSVGGATPFLLHIVQLPLQFLRTVELIVHGPGTVAFLQCHGAKLQELHATPKTIVEADVFNICTNLNALTVRRAYDGSDEYMVKCIACSTPHASLAKIHFVGGTLIHSHIALKARKEVVSAMPVFEELAPQSFPVLKEIQIDDIKWPTSEQQARKDPWITLSEILHQKGIKVTDRAGVCGPTGARAKRSTRRR